MRGRKGVRRVPLVKHRKGSNVVLGGKVGIKLTQEVPSAHCLVNQDLRRKRTDITRHVSLFMQTFKLLTSQVQPALHRVRFPLQGIGDQYLTNPRHGTEGNLTETLRVNGNITPLQYLQVVGRQTALEDVFGTHLSHGEQYHAYAQQFFIADRNASFANQQRPRNCCHHANAITALSVRGRGAPMGQPRQGSQRLA